MTVTQTSWTPTTAATLADPDPGSITEAASAGYRPDDDADDPRGRDGLPYFTDVSAPRDRRGRAARREAPVAHQDHARGVRRLARGAAAARDSRTAPASAAAIEGESPKDPAEGVPAPGLVP
jgi:hypothetical protein